MLQAREIVFEKIEEYDIVIKLFLPTNIFKVFFVLR